MPTQWTLTLTPPPPAPVDPRHLHALACHMLETPTTDHTAPTKPFTAALNSGRLVLGLLDDSRPLERLAVPAGTALRLGSRTFHCSPVGHRAEPYARLAACPPAIKAHMEFRTPTYVKRSGRQVPLPDPDLLLAGLARRWAALSPLPLPAAAVTGVLESVHLARHDTRTEVCGQGPAQRVGFVGSATFGLSGRPSLSARRAFAALWSFASFAGTGAQTTHGFGHVHVRLQHSVTVADPGDAGVREKNTSPPHPSRTTDRTRNGAG
ncbi:CRISPR system precrRNA processing endoribonuclease RAMP protein Cas6 [Nocardiopsis lambiniae]|uniref:CRISPR system precrRNA processing endoribonuclease RAMP protein Cas6 n=1 Tax=Nocardiopsis lambiniae TaxID=3075539 RepID=A0ABU2M2Z6_9ACTN|nr:CRISPR system precrRNA processing endoribonuclease RAMP protein Cas6 [Nocardiopsis sp. DSM 44743]MDT0326992.1 CRISPR system precrRNA processing endoribonuclease RAMP protein Cas6 [Nocardiopsis sp. DSM 44743]